MKRLQFPEEKETCFLISCWFRPQKAAPNDRQHERLLPMSSRHDPGERGCHVLSRHRASVPNQNIRPAPGLRPSRGQVYQHLSQERVDRQSPSNNSDWVIYSDFYLGKCSFFLLQTFLSMDSLDFLNLFSILILFTFSAFLIVSRI